MRNTLIKNNLDLAESSSGLFARELVSYSCWLLKTAIKKKG